ncbi:MAG: pitrilysin family protein [Syntrophomonadaceae bacterium]|nr:pitrilysin family protein [Syntrophomonadaceae bacterium]
MLVHVWQLENGAKLVAEPIAGLHSAAVGVYIRVGSRHEDEIMAGSSHFVEHMLFKGTHRLSARDIAERFEAMGGQLNAFTSREHTCVYARVLDEDIDAATEIIFDMLFNSCFAERDFATEREVVLEEISMYEDTPDDLIHDVFASAMWQGQPMGIPILGTRDNLEAMSRDMLFAYYRQHYHPSQMVIAVAGNVEPERIRERMERLGEGRGAAPQQTEIAAAQAAEPFIRTVEKDTEQVQLCIGLPGICWHDTERYAQNLFNSIFGGGMSSRLFQRLREEMGLAYSVHSYTNMYSDTGMFGVYAGTGPGKLTALLEALKDELSLLEQNGIGAEELARAKKLMKTSVYLGLESVMNRMTRLARGILMYDEVTPVEEVIARYEAVTPERLQQYIHRLLGLQPLSLAAIGPAEVMPGLIDEFGRLYRED